MTRTIGTYEFERRKLYASAKLELTEAVGAICEKYRYDITYVELANIMYDSLGNYLKDMLKDEWQDTRGKHA
jgi:hypothetical protein